MTSTRIPQEDPAAVRTRDGVADPATVGPVTRRFNTADPTAEQAIANLEGPERVWFRRDAVGYGLALFEWRDSIAERAKHVGYETAKQAQAQKLLDEGQEWLAAYRAKLGR